MPDTPLNQDALSAAGRLYGEIQGCVDARNCAGCKHEAAEVIRAYLAVAQPVLDEAALANLIMWKELPFGGNPDNYIRLDANAAHKVIELLKPHLAAQASDDHSHCYALGQHECLSCGQPPIDPEPRPRGYEENQK